MKTFTKLIKYLGFDRAISYGLTSRFWGLISGPITMLLIASKFTKEQQGFYYTFGSILALQIFFELGLSTVIAQFASHEFAFLRWGDHGQIEGDSTHKMRFLDLITKSTKWFGIASVFVVISITPVGLMFFNQEHSSAIAFSWRIPWSLAVLGTAINLLMVPFLAVIRGSGDVEPVNRLSMVGSIVGSCMAWLTLGLNGGLYSIFAVALGNNIISCVYLIRQKPVLLKLVWDSITATPDNVEGPAAFSWRKELWPLQWKIALTWVSGYFLFQLFNPILFKYHGPIIAGQMGMTLNASNALLGVSMTWMYTRSPEFGKFVAKLEWEQLDKLFFRTLSQSIWIVILGAIVGSGVIWFLQAHYQIGQRFIPASQAALLFVNVCVLLIICGFGVYLRAHKKEPFLLLSLILSILQGWTTWYFGMKYSSLGVTASFFIITLTLNLPISFVIWAYCRKKWHKNDRLLVCNNDIGAASIPSTNNS